MKTIRMIVALAACSVFSASYAATARYTVLNAPDSVSRSILATHYKTFQDGAAGPADVRAALHRNFADVIEHNLAAMPAADMAAWLDQMSDRELADLAQLYTNSNAVTVRSGRALQVFAGRLDPVRLRRLSKFFGTNEVNSAVLAVAPAKFNAVAAGVELHAAPVAGASLAAAPRVAMASRLGNGGVAPMQTAPNVDMSLSEIYLNFRTLPVGALSPQAALYETSMYAGKNLVIAWGVGYGFGTEITTLMQTYAPTWYYGTFVDTVGGSINSGVTWLQGLVGTTYNLFSTNQSSRLGSYQNDTLPTMGAWGASGAMGNTGGDLGMEDEFEDWSSGGGRCTGFGGYCAPTDLN